MAPKIILFTLLPAFATALLISYLAMPVIIKIASLKQLTDNPDSRRKTHENVTPTLGGIGIFSAFLISFSIWGNAVKLESYPFFVAALFMLFLIGVKDDILMISPLKKFMVQLFAAAEMVLAGGVVLTDFGGILGIYQVPWFLGAVITIFIFVMLINSYNLIDGIDGLAGGIGIVVTGILGIWFWITAFISLAVLCFTLMGALIGFMSYNMHPAQIFMGDTGSMAVGFILAYLSIQFLISNQAITESIWHFNNAPVFAVALLIIPIIDTVRVFFLRLISGKSPFAADRNHTHHKLLDMDMAPDVASFCLWMGNFTLIAFAFYFNYLEVNTLLFLVMAGGFMILPLIKLSLKSQRRFNRKLRISLERNILSDRKLYLFNILNLTKNENEKKDRHETEST